MYQPTRFITNRFCPKCRKQMVKINFTIYFFCDKRDGGCGGVFDVSPSGELVDVSKERG